MKLPIHGIGTLPISYYDLYEEMPEDELQEALGYYAQARGLTEEKLGRPLTSEEFKERARLYARHQTMVRKYDPFDRIKEQSRAKLHEKVYAKLKAKRKTLTSS